MGVFDLFNKKKKQAEEYYNTGLELENIKGEKENQIKAVEWYRKAAEMGNAKAQNNLGICYATGEGVKKDLVKAVEWYTKAVEQGDVIAQSNLGECYFNGEGVEKDLKKAVEWYTKAAELGNANAQFNLGRCYFNGEGVEKDLKIAVGWYTKAAEQGYAMAACDLGFCYYEGEGVIKDVEKAREIWGKTSESHMCYDRAVYFGEIAYLEEHYPKANRMFDLALNIFTPFNERDKGAFLAYLWKGKVYTKLDKYESALVYLDKAIKNSTNEDSSHMAEVLREKAKVLGGLKRIKEARETLKTCLEYSMINNQSAIIEEVENDLNGLPPDDENINNVTYLSADTVIQGNVGVYAKDDAIVNRPIVGRIETDDPKNIYCPDCGKKLPVDARFCMGCGKRL